MKAVIASVLLFASITLVAAEGNGGLYKIYDASDCNAGSQKGFVWIDPAHDSLGNRTVDCTESDVTNGIYYTFDPTPTRDPNYNANGWPFFGQLKSANVADCDTINLYGGQLSTCLTIKGAGDDKIVTFLISKCDGTGVSYDFGLSTACAYNYPYNFNSGTCAISDSFVGFNGCAVSAPTSAPVSAPVAAPVAQNTPTGTPIVSNTPIDSNPPVDANPPTESNPPIDPPTGSNIPTASTPTSTPTTTPSATPKGKVAAGSTIVAGIMSLATATVLLF